MGLLTKTEYLGKLLKIKFSKKYFPINITICITGKCNFKCIYCYGEYSGKENPNDMTTPQILDIIKQLIKKGTQYFSISGGEPLLQKDAGKIIDYIKSKNCECSLSTNCSLLPERINEIKKVDLIVASLDGCESENDLNRGKGSFKKTMKGIETALSYGIPVVINAVLTKHNKNSAGYLTELGKKMGIKIKFSFMVYSDSQSKNDKFGSISLNDEETSDILKEIISLKKSGAPILYTEKAYRLALNWKDFSKLYYWNEPPDFKYAKCYSAKMFYHIDSDSSVYPCSMFFDSFPRCRILELGLDKALECSAENNRCVACYKPSYIEHNLIYGCDIPVILANIKEAF
ncbi:MAG TPA: radical SAM protein [bacterium]|nr:radical SAM protein [bacterium]HPN32090.1 radical SAM protein [bacterium]